MGITALSSWRRIGVNSGIIRLNPVTFPPGREAFNKSVSHRVAGARHNNGSRRTHVLRRQRALAVGGDNEIDTGAHGVYREVAIEFGLSRRPAPLDDDRMTLHLSEVAQTPSECFGTCGLRSPWTEHAYSVQRLGTERRKREAESKNDRAPDPPHEHLGGKDGWRAV